MLFLLLYCSRGTFKIVHDKFPKICIEYNMAIAPLLLLFIGLL